MVGAEFEDRVRGHAIAEWVGRVPEDVPALIAGVHGDGIARLICTSLRRGGGRSPIEVDVSAALLTEGDQECFGFTLRARAEPTADSPQEARRSSLLRSIASIEAELGTTTPTPVLLERGRRLLEQYLAQVVLDRAGGDSTRAAVLMGLAEHELEQLRAGPSSADGPAST
jgi:hypothetical protein